jgi:Uma2 family endonuclease
LLDIPRSRSMKIRVVIAGMVHVAGRRYDGGAMEIEKPPGTWTYRDLEGLPQDGRRYEIFDGELIVSPGPNLAHQAILGNLYAALRAQLQERGIAMVFFAPFDVILEPTKVVQPDLFAVRHERRKDAVKMHGIVAAPDLAIEILSPSSRAHDRVRKRRFYARNRIREYWLVDPEVQTVEVLELIEGGLTYRQHGWYASGDRVRSATFALEIDVDAIFDLWDEGDSEPPKD